MIQAMASLLGFYGLFQTSACLGLKPKTSVSPAADVGMVLDTAWPALCAKIYYCAAASFFLHCKIKSLVAAILKRPALSAGRFNMLHFHDISVVNISAAATIC